MHIENYDLIIK